MTKIEEIANRLKSKVEYEFNEREKETWEPITIETYTLPEFKITQSNSTGKRGHLKNKLSKVLAFIDSVKHKRSKNGCTIMPISSTSKSNLEIWYSERGVCNGISFMKEIGLISDECTKRRFNAHYKKDNLCRTYRYYVENEIKIKDYCKKHGIRKHIAENRIYTDKEITAVHKDIDKSKVKFSSNLRLTKPKGMSKGEFEKELTFCLYENYPMLREMIEKANLINKKYYKNFPEFKVRFQPRFKWTSGNAYVSGIGIRATNSMISVKKEDRPDVLKNYGFNVEFDINASVPRMTLSLNRGEWIGTTDDLYKLIYFKMYPDRPFDGNAREAIKNMHMRAYFDASNDAISHHIWLRIDQEGIDKQEVAEEMKKLRQAIETVEGGKLYNNEIFFVESCVYLMTLEDLLEIQELVWEVYDCFYGKGNLTQNEFEELVGKRVKYNFNKFFKEFKTQ